MHLYLQWPFHFLRYNFFFSFTPSEHARLVGFASLAFNVFLSAHFHTILFFTSFPLAAVSLIDISSLPFTVDMKAGGFAARVKGINTNLLTWQRRLKRKIGDLQFKGIDFRGFVRLRGQ